MESTATPGFGRRTLIKSGVALGAVSLAGPAIIKARGETPVKIGVIEPLTGSLSETAQSTVEGEKYAATILNATGGILGRPIELLVEDSANDPATGVEKARKLIGRDHVHAILGDGNSATAYAIMQVTNEKDVLQIVPGAHSDPITGKGCQWNVFRVCNTTGMDASAITPELIKRYGKRWYIITPDYAYGYSLQAAFVRALKKAKGEYEAAVVPISASDYSATLIKANLYKPDVLLNNMGGGLAMVDCMKQFVAFGMNKKMGVGGALFDLESILAVPRLAQIGWWNMEWWWNQPNVPEAVAFVKQFRAALKKTPSARHWFGYVAVQSVKLAAEKAKSLKAIDMAHVLAGMELPPDVALQPGKVFYRAGDHELMANVFVGEVHPAPAGANKADVFTVADLVPADKVWPLTDTGCHMTYPS